MPISTLGWPLVTDRTGDVLARQAGQGRQPDSGAAALASTSRGVGPGKGGRLQMGFDSRLVELGGGYEFADLIGACLRNVSTTAIVCALVQQAQNDACTGIVLSRVCRDEGRGGARRFRLVLECFT